VAVSPEAVPFPTASKGLALSLSVVSSFQVLSFSSENVSFADLETVALAIAVAVATPP